MIGDTELLQRFGYMLDATEPRLANDIDFQRLLVKGYYRKTGAFYFQTEAAQRLLKTHDIKKPRAYGPGSDFER